MSILPPMPLNTPRRWALATLVLGACIQRTPVSQVSATGGAGNAATSNTAATAFGSVSGESVLGTQGLKAFELQGDVGKVELTTIKVEGQPFTEALRPQITQASGSDWSVQLQAKSVAPIEAGDMLLATFYLRSEKPQDGGATETSFVFELAHAPYTKSVTYPVQANGDWSKVQVRFVAHEHYGAGEAQMIFRLGYEPEAFAIGGISVENFGKKLAFSALPASEAQDRKREFRPGPPVRLEPIEGGELAFEIAPSKVIGRISPYVYGVNSQNAAGLNVSVRRMGGNRQTAYNWELNASSAGSDYRHVNDDWPCTTLGFKNCNEPGAQFLDFVEGNRKAGIDSIVTLPLVDYVSADKSGEVKEAEKAPSKRWNRSYLVKNKPFSLTPDLTDKAVYQDEFVHFLVERLGKADKGGIRFYALDNEPALWPSTHPRIHPEKTTYQEIVTRSEALAAAITKEDPSALVLGGMAYGWSEYLSLQDAPDSKDWNSKSGGTYIDFYLASMKRLEEKAHRRLLHVFDVHWYPEVKGTKRITETDISAKTVAARLQAPRSLWDPAYQEKSWIGDSWGKPIRLIPWLEERIAQNYPGTKLSMTEYNYGAGADVSGGLAQADVLGIFGREGLFMATYWGNGPGTGDLPPYIAAAFKLYRNYDGKGGTYGDTAVTATTDPAKASVYAALDSKRPNVLTIIAINKDQRARYAGKITLQGNAKYGSARAYALDKSGPQVREAQALEIKDNVIDYQLAPLSATLFVCEKR
jgi:Glycoside hydrolase family 44